MNRGAWRATVYRVAKNRTWLKRLNMHSRRQGTGVEKPGESLGSHGWLPLAQAQPESISQPHWVTRSVIKCNLKLSRPTHHLCVNCSFHFHLISQLTSIPEALFWLRLSPHLFLSVIYLDWPLNQSTLKKNVSTGILISQSYIENPLNLDINIWTWSLVYFVEKESQQPSNGCKDMLEPRRDCLLEEIRKQIW